MQLPSTLVKKALRGAAIAAIGSAAVLGTAGAASASPSASTVHANDAGYQVSWTGSPYLMTASYDTLNVAVPGSSTSIGTGLIQWPADGGNEQAWYFGTVTYDGAYQGTLIDNANSGLCVDTDGNAGDQVFQQTCEFGNANELFDINGGLDAYSQLQNVGTGLYLDVSGYSWNEGAAIDLWYGNDQPNQTFFLLPW